MTVFQVWVAAVRRPKAPAPDPGADRRSFHPLKPKKATDSVGPFPTNRLALAMKGMPNTLKHLVQALSAAVKEKGALAGDQCAFRVAGVRRTCQPG